MAAALLTLLLRFAIYAFYVQLTTILKIRNYTNVASDIFQCFRVTFSAGDFLRWLLFKSR